MRLLGRWSPLLGVLDRERARLAWRISEFAGDPQLLVGALRAEFVDKRPSLLHRALEVRATVVCEALEDGATLDRALASRRGDFADWEIGLARLAVESREPQRPLFAWARRWRQSADVKDAVSNAFLYPFFLAFTFLVAWGIVLWKVLPTLAALYSSSRAALPLSTRIMAWLSDAIADLAPGLFLIAGTLTAVGIVLRLLAPELAIWTRLRDRVPLLGRQARAADRAFALELLAGRLADGGEPADSLSRVAAVMPNAVARKELSREATRWAEGEVVETGSAGRLLDAPTRRALARCLEARDGAERLTRLASAEAQRADHVAERGLAAFEPLVVLAGGLLLGSGVLATMQPVFELVPWVQP